MSILLFLNGYLTIVGLIGVGVGSVTRMIGQEELGSQIQDWGWIASGLGAARKGVKQYKGLN